MSETVITIEIAKAYQAALTPILAAVPGGATFSLSGVDSGDVRMPACGIRVAECKPLGHGSKMLTFPTALQWATNWHDDTDAITLHTGAHAISRWLMSNPRLTLTLATCDALYVPAAPDYRDVVAPTGMIYQMMQWQIETKVSRVV